MMITSIGRSVTIDGDLTSDEDLLIDGQVHGHIHLRNAELTIGTGARIDADVRGTRITILGTVRGNISASERIELGPAADVTGSLSANRIAIDDGARFNGRIDMDRRTIAAKVAQYKAAEEARGLGGPL